MSLDEERIARDVAARLSSASSVLDACQATVAVLGRQAPARASIFLWVHDRLRCVAAAGTWLVYATVPADEGVVGRVYASGKTETIPAGATDAGDLPLRPDASAQTCTPVLDPTGRPMGVLDLVWNGPVDLDSWRFAAEAIADRLGRRIEQLGGPPAETCAERLLRHVAEMNAATTEWDLLAAARAAARDVSGLTSTVLILCGRRGPRIIDPTVAPNELEVRVRAALAGADPSALDQLIQATHRYGASYTSGEAGSPTNPTLAPLVDAGVGTLIAVPVGPPDTGGVLLVAGERTARPDPAAANLLELLAAQAWTCLGRLRRLKRLRERARSDPLTGLPHHGPFAERMTAATGRTALLAIDVDNFKSVNDTYGHQAGDQVLVNLARALEAALRHGDELYRIGGDEFVAVVEVGRPEEAIRIGERLIDAAHRIGRTISVGVGLRRDGESPELTLRRADAALYEVKRQGRDGVRLADTR